MAEPKICIYTAVFGGYDPLRSAVKQSLPTDFVCFTDRIGIGRSKPWIVRRSIAKPSMSPRMQAKWFKMHAHKLFPNGAPLVSFWPFKHRRYDFTIWIDASLEVTSPTFAAEVISQVGSSGLAVFPHPDRDCIFDEAVASSHWAKYKGQNLSEQAAAYRAEGYPAHNGLVAAGILVRDVNAPNLPGLDEAWWEENLRWTYQDQLSLPVVWWRAGQRFSVINAGLWTNSWFRYHPHPNEEGVLPEYR